MSIERKSGAHNPRQRVEGETEKRCEEAAGKAGEQQVTGARGHQSRGRELPSGRPLGRGVGGDTRLHRGCCRLGQEHTYFH